jgi:putative ABC transport system permease protein
MLRNYLNTAIRNTIQNFGYTLVNVTGLAVGLACVILIGLYVLDEVSYDGYHEKADRTYRLVVESLDEDGEVRYTPGAIALGHLIATQVPGVETVVRRSSQMKAIIYEDRVFPTRACIADSTFFDVFDFEFIAGNARTALRSPAGIVIARSVAERVYGTSDVLGRELVMDDRYYGGTWTISGVVDDAPTNSLIQIGVVTAQPQSERGKLFLQADMWWDGPAYIHMMLDEGVSAEIAAARIQHMIHDHTDPDWSQGVRIHLQELANVHLGTRSKFGVIRGNGDSDLQGRGSLDAVLMFGAAAILILCVACVNYVNLSTARSMTRVREIGLRKVVGAEKKQLIGQLLGESILQAVVASILAVLLIGLVIEAFNTLAQKQIALSEWGAVVWASLLVVSVTVGTLAGLYPAIVISSVSPAIIFRGTTLGQSKGFLRRGLVVFQFGACITLVIGSLVISEQMAFVSGRDLGFQKDQVVAVGFRMHKGFMERFGLAIGLPDAELFKERVVQHPGIDAAEQFGYFLERNEQWTIHVDGQSHRMRIVSGGPTFPQMVGLELADGRFIENAPLLESYDPHEGVPFMINETAQEMIGGGAVGKPFRMAGYTGQVVGVLKDFKDESLMNAVEPLVFLPNWKAAYVGVRLNGSDVQGAISHIKQSWRELVPNRPCDYRFLSDFVDANYRSEARTQTMMRWFTFLALFVAAMGLLGLAVASTGQRRKEIGIRKAVGASETSVFSLLSGEYLKLVVMANGVAWPIAWYLSDQWLGSFAYRIELGVLPFLAGAMMTLVVALGTVAYQAIRASRTDPVVALRQD